MTSPAISSKSLDAQKKSPAHSLAAQQATEGAVALARRLRPNSVSCPLTGYLKVKRMASMMVMQGC